MPEERRAIVTGPLRCSRRIENSPDAYCAELAAYMVPSHSELEPLFFCERHGDPTMLPIAGDFRIRRITVRLDVLFSGLPIGAQASHVEALGQLERAVVAAGGLLNLHDVRSELVRYAVQPARQDERRRQGG